jgi:hypothetical protein
MRLAAADLHDRPWLGCNAMNFRTQLPGKFTITIFV